MALTRNNSRLIQATEDRLKSLQFSNDQIQQLKKSRTTQQRVTFYSPHQGVVENLKIRAGFYVKPGDTLMAIGALENIWVEVDILEKQSTMIALNQPVSMTLDYVPDRTWEGQVDFIYPTLDAMTRTLKVRLRFNNDDHVLKPNMYAQIRIEAHDDIKTLVGSIWLMYLEGFNYSVAVGFIALAGVAVEIGVIMLVYLNQSYQSMLQNHRTNNIDLSNESLLAAVTEGAGLRVRPVMMTSLSIIIGLLPILYGTGTGSEVMSRIAAPMVGGMISALVLTLIVLPVIYYLWRSSEYLKTSTAIK